MIRTSLTTQGRRRSTDATVAHLKITSASMRDKQVDEDTAIASLKNTYKPHMMQFVKKVGMTLALNPLLSPWMVSPVSRDPSIDDKIHRSEERCE